MEFYMKVEKVDVIALSAKGTIGGVDATLSIFSSSIALDIIKAQQIVNDRSHGRSGIYITVNVHSRIVEVRTK